MADVRQISAAVIVANKRGNKRRRKCGKENGLGEEQSEGFIGSCWRLEDAALCYLSHGKKLSDFLFLNCFLDMSFRFCFPLFSQNVNRDSRRMEVLLFSVSYCPPKSIIYSFLRVQFSRLLSRGKEDI